MSPEGPYPEQTSAQRKNALFNGIIDLFDKGKVRAVPATVPCALVYTYTVHTYIHTVGT